jgi:uncharacterized protein (TIGR04222 family)
MNAYLFYLIYVAAVAAFSILLLRREGDPPNRAELPHVLEVALLRGGLGAVVETVVFDLHLRKLIELKVDSRNKQVVAALNPENIHSLSTLEHDSLKAFEDIQGPGGAIKKARRQMSASVKEIETVMQTAGWWKSPARWKWGLTILSPGLIVFGSLRFIDAYEGGLQVALALTVPIFAVIIRRLILYEMTGPTARGCKILKRRREAKQNKQDLLWQVALHGTQQLEELPEYRLFCFMTRAIPYGRL